MKVKKQVIPTANLVLYFCPNCNRGHQVQKGMKKCEICGVELEWEQEDEEQGKRSK